MAVLRAEGVTKRYGSREVLTSATLRLEPGALTALVGRNGAGKSTLLRICAGWVRADSGVVLLDGEVRTGAPPHALARHGLFYLPERGLLSPYFTLRQHAAAVLRRYASGPTRIDEVAETVGVRTLLDRSTHTYSGGERRRAEVWLAFLRSPRCLLADEPLRGIDPRDAEAVLAGMREIAATGCAILLTGHELPALLPAVDRVLGLAGGTTQTLSDSIVGNTVITRPLSAKPVVGPADGTTQPLGDAAEDSEAATGLAAGPGLSTPRPEPRKRAVAGTAAPRQPLPEAALVPPSASRAGPASQSARAGAADSGGGAMRPGAGSPSRARLARLRIDDQTLGDIEVFRSQDDGPGLFDLLDDTRTSGGQARLRERFRAPLTDPGEIEAVQDALRFFLKHPEPFARLPTESLLKEVEAYLRSAYVTSRPSGPFGSWVTAVWYRLCYRDLFESAERGVRATRRLLHSIHGVVGNLRWLETPAPIAALVQEIINTLERHEVRQLGDAESGALRARDVLPFDQVIRERLRPEIERVIAGIHELDALRSMASATAAQGFVFPTIHDRGTNRVEIRGLYHPFLTDPIRNDLVLDEDGAVVFLTGPNMAGKTTYIRAAATCVYLAHLGLGVPAERVELSPFDALFSSVNTVDTVRLGYSYYFSEVRRVKQAAVLMCDGHRVFAIFDELFKGTNVRDAYDASRAVLAGFASVRQATVLVSSHLSELVEDLESIESIRFRYFSADIRDGEPTYSYRLQEGASAQRLGMLLLEREQVLDLLGQAPPRPGHGSTDE